MSSNVRSTDRKTLDSAATFLLETQTKVRQNLVALC